MKVFVVFYYSALHGVRIEGVYEHEADANRAALFIEDSGLKADYAEKVVE